MYQVGGRNGFFRALGPLKESEEARGGGWRGGVYVVAVGHYVSFKLFDFLSNLFVLYQKERL